jgi:hypothetical protein
MIGAAVLPQVRWVAKSICFFANVWPQLKTPAPVIKSCKILFSVIVIYLTPISLRRYFFGKLIFQFSRDKFWKKRLAQMFWASDNTSNFWTKMVKTGRHW